MMIPVEVRALSDYRLFLRYADGAEGVVDLSEFAGRGVFSIWNDYAVFQNVRIGSHGALEWGDEVDMCADALYLRLTGKRPEVIFPSLQELGTDA